jgi:hypothetical protein
VKLAKLWELEHQASPKPRAPSPGSA